METRPLPKWAQLQYAILWSKLKDKQFTHEQASKILKKDSKVLSILLLHLRKNRWITEHLNSEDSRKRIYTLKSPEKIMEGIANGK